MDGVAGLVEDGVGRAQHAVAQEDEVVVGRDAEVAHGAEARLQLADDLGVRHLDGHAGKGKVDGALEVVERAVDLVKAVGVGAARAKVCRHRVGQGLRQQREGGAAVEEHGHGRVVVLLLVAARRRQAHVVHVDPVPRDAVGRLGRRYDRLAHERARKLASVDASKDDHTLLLAFATQRQTKGLGLCDTLHLQLVDEIGVGGGHVDAVADAQNSREFIHRSGGRSKLHVFECNICGRVSNLLATILVYYMTHSILQIQYRL